MPGKQSRDLGGWIFVFLFGVILLVSLIVSIAQRNSGRGDVPARAAGDVPAKPAGDVSAGVAKVVEVPRPAGQDSPWIVRIATSDGKEIQVHPYPLDDGSYVINVVTKEDFEADDGLCWGTTIKPVPIDRSEK